MAVAAAILEANYINGEWLPGTYDTVADIINPANQQSLAQIALSSEADTARAIEAAAVAFPHGA